MQFWIIVNQIAGEKNCQAFSLVFCVFLWLSKIAA